MVLYVLYFYSIQKYADVIFKEIETFLKQNKATDDNLEKLDCQIKAQIAMHKTPSGPKRPVFFILIILNSNSLLIQQKQNNKNNLKDLKYLQFQDLNIRILVTIIIIQDINHQHLQFHHQQNQLLQILLPLLQIQMFTILSWILINHIIQRKNH